MFRIIHISDLHFTEDLHQSTVISALCRDIRSVCELNKPAAVVFSGDIAAKGQTNNVNIEKILSHFVSEIRNTVGSDLPFLICPGNHDVDLGRRAKFLSPIFEKIKTPDEASELVRQALDPASVPLWEHLAGFRKLAVVIDEDAFSRHPIFYTKVISNGASKIGFACLNSAWMTQGGGRNDYGSLYVGEYALDLARKELADPGIDMRIAIFHHPLEWLAPEERSNIQRYLTLNFDGFLCGHKHDNNANSLHSNIGNLFTSNTGCVYQTREYFNGYSIIDIDREGLRWLINAREYYLERNEFDDANRFAPMGKWETPFTTHQQGTKVVIHREVIKAVHERANSMLLSYNSSELAPKSMGAIFVEPPLSVFSEKELVAKMKGAEPPPGSYTGLAALAAMQRTILLVGKREAGKSLLLHQIAVNYYQEFHPIARIGLVLDVNALKKMTSAGLLEQAVEFCGSEIARRDLVKLLDAGETLVCIDNVRPHDAKVVDVVRGLMMQYPKARYILAASEEILESVTGNASSHLDSIAQKVYVHTFRRKHTKELVKRWFGSGDAALEQRVDVINKLLSRLRVPTTPFLVSVLSWVLEQRPNANVINQASAIEVLIEGLLEKFNESKARKEFDSTIQQHFLAEFATLLDSQDADWVPVVDFDSFIAEYFKKRGLSVSTDGFSAELIRKGLIYSFDHRVGFKFDCFRAFFLARKFAETPSMWRDALTAKNVHRYVTELDLFTGLHRDRADVLRKSGELCSQMAEEIDVDFPLDEIDRLDAAIDQDVLEVIQKKILSNDSKHYKKELENERPNELSADHEHTRKRKHLPDIDQVSRYMESLRAFSVILRNSELVDDVELKRSSFDLALEMWANASIAVILSLPDQAKEVIEGIAGKGEERNFGKSASSLVRAIIPQVMVAIIAEVLATPKLQLFIRERAADPRTLVRVLSVFLALDSDDLDAMKMIEDLLRDFKKNSFVVEMVFFKLLTIHMTGGSMANHRNFRELMGNSFVLLRGAQGQEANLLKGRFLNQLDKKLGVSENF
ncbi:3',5'-cyclic AMP phosphodiesterase CpdA [Variovorax sp. YR266]|uniref:metallophosphoesterase n=1 Tax=Variovorax sp. YR266 TaxID=1884386 RepID=UPI0008965AAC|nr:metallophosphoesterase [Variovorax sp. YR266]SDY41303.1 3',5'-cyclic AMP phosphodiesterase CpdA [Variovorax sp. YR266]